MKKYIIFSIFILGFVCNNYCQNEYFNKWPINANPIKVGNKLVERFLEQPHSIFGKIYHDKYPTHLTYPDVYTWVGALMFSEITGNKELENRLIERFEPIMGKDSCLQPIPNHVDVSVFGTLPLMLYKITKLDKYYEMGIRYADAQWILPHNWTLKNQPKRKSQYYGMLDDANIFQYEQKMWSDKGYSWQTRMWLDDMFMITCLQSRAYIVTGDRKYIDRTAYEMVAYMDSLQLDSGLFDHSPDVPFRWARGNGWMAVGFSELLRLLPGDNKYRQKIMDGYLKMMKTLLEYQGENGMWRQLVDDTSLWYEASGTAMFTYAFIVGVKNGWLPEELYGPAARKAWLALVDYINTDGDVGGVCEGTNVRNSHQYYVDRKCIIGDLHGQAPVLWCATALLWE